MLNIDSLQNGIVIDHIKAGTSMVLYDLLELGKLDCCVAIKVGVIGINGTGKSTFLKVLSGAIEPDSGTLSRNPNVQISFLSQNPDMDPSATALEQVFLHFPAEFRQLAGCALVLQPGKAAARQEPQHQTGRRKGHCRSQKKQDPLFHVFQNDTSPALRGRVQNPGLSRPDCQFRLK